MSIQDVVVTRLLVHPRGVTNWLCESYGPNIFNVHHECHPKREFRLGIAQEFRALPCHQFVTRREEHSDGHHSGRYQPLPKPTATEMQKKIDECYGRGCSKEQCVRPIRVCMADVPVELASHPQIEIIDPPF